jgi:hypothetical protein
MRMDVSVTSKKGAYFSGIKISIQYYLIRYKIYPQLQRGVTE